GRSWHAGSKSSFEFGLPQRFFLESPLIIKPWSLQEHPCVIRAQTIRIMLEEKCKCACWARRLAVVFPNGIVIVPTAAGFAPGGYEPSRGPSLVWQLVQTADDGFC